MDSFLRKQKPRPRTTTSSPPSTLTEAPRAIVCPATVASLDDSRLSAAPRTPPLVSHSLPSSETLSSAPKPRKRFRKKVSGLFGDQTDLKKRMSKLLIAARADDVVSSVKNLERPTSRCVSRDTITSALGLSGAECIIARLEETISVRDVSTQAPDEFDTPEFVANASRTLGSPEKLQTVRKTMGRLSPRSNERFLAELELGTAPQTKPDADGRGPITPPDLPSVDSSEFYSEREWLSSPVSVERTGAPAVLRRKARRLDRGYRCADVLRARLGGEHHRTRKRLEAFDLELGDVRGRAKRNAKKDKVLVSDQGDVETDTDEDILSPQPASSGRRGPALAANDPFQMLVEVAAVEQKNSAPSTGRDVPLERHRHKRKIEDEKQSNRRKVEDERRDSKRRKEIREGEGFNA